MLITATLSGIQEYVFAVRETKGGQARALRARSFQVQMISECVALRLLRALGLVIDPHPSRILIRAAAKFVLDVGELNQQQRTALDEAVLDMHRWLRDHTQGRIRLSLGTSRPDRDPVTRYRSAQHRLADAKSKPWRAMGVNGVGWRSEELVVRGLLNREAEADLDRDIGKGLADATFVTVLDGRDSAAAGQPGATPGFDAVGLRVELSRGRAEGSRVVHCEPANRFVFHVPTSEDGGVMEFVELAGKSRGAQMLGVLKADADSLGRAFDDKLNSSSNQLLPVVRFSERLNSFFARCIDQQMRQGGTHWHLLYTVFAGGDDVLIVAPWNVSLHFAGHLQRLFSQQFAAEGLTISAGVALVKPTYPIRLAARQAEHLLEQAKTQLAHRADRPKDQIAGLGMLWKWSDHEKIIAAGKQLADWVDSGVIQRGWLHTLLELALLRRGQGGPEYNDVSPAVATSRLAYHIARNWPRTTRDPRHDADLARSKAREWADEILKQLDQYESTNHLDTIYLPAIVRYAMLATRSGTSEDGA